MSEIKLAYAIWPWGTEKKEQLVQALKDIRDAGFTAFESVKNTIEIFENNAMEFKKIVNEFGVHPVSFYFHLTGDESFDVNDLERKMEFLAENNIHRISLQAPRLEGRSASKEELALVLKTIEKIGKVTKSYKVTPCIHPHHNTMIMYENEIDFIMNNTDPEYIAFGPDTAHLMVAGCEPAEIFKRYIQRIKFIHLKDFKNNTGISTKGVGTEGVEVYSNFIELGEGNVNLLSVFKILKEYKYNGYATAELDISRFTNKESAIINMRYLKKNL